ncbi:glycosyltransferase [Demequina sp.]|uniref:glycosyltransferase n=1 Tax=Demequina sp. TaxID=2050685 RepID=UPI003A89AEA7
MTPRPDVAIVIPVHNDEQWIRAALDSCLSQTHADVEVICVDDASTDGTRELIATIAAHDARVRLIEMAHNVSALQCRRAGIEAAQADFVLFLDGDDLLDDRAVALTLAKARETQADVVGFGVTVLDADGRTVGGYQTRLAPVHDALEGDDVLRGLFPTGRRSQGQLWRYLFRRSVLEEAYRHIPRDVVLRRVNDLPLMFLVAAVARRYVSIPERVYTYHFRRGESGHRVRELDQFEFYLSALDSTEAIARAVDQIGATHNDPALVHEAFANARQSLVSNVLGYLTKNVSTELQSEALMRLHDRVAPLDVLIAAARFSRESLEVLVAHADRPVLGERPVRSVLLVTATLTTGGVSGVLLSQARFLLAAGYRVTIAARKPGSDPSGVPDGAVFVELSGDDLAAQVEGWTALCASAEVDVIIDHQVLYSREWPAFALAAATHGAATIGWIHNFALRPVYDQNGRSSFLQSHLRILAQVVSLSPLDVGFWKLRGIGHAVYLPNPPSPMLLEASSSTSPRPGPAGRIELIWVGRLDQHTKQVLELIDVAVELGRLDVDFHLRVIGPAWGGFTAEDVQKEVNRRAVADRVSVEGPLHGTDLVDAIDAADMFVTTSVIEGYQLTIPEAQSRGLPVAMYALPWLTVVQGNRGVVSVAQGDAAALATQIADIVGDPERYAALSAASLEAARVAGSYDFATLYTQLIEGRLPAEFSPDPTLDDARQLLDFSIFFAERAALNPRRSTPQRDAGAPKTARRPLGRKARLARQLRRVPGLEALARRAWRAVAR